MFTPLTPRFFNVPYTGLIPYTGTISHPTGRDLGRTGTPLRRHDEVLQGTREGFISSSPPVLSHLRGTETPPSSFLDVPGKTLGPHK